MYTVPYPLGFSSALYIHGAYKRGRSSRHAAHAVPSWPFERRTGCIPLLPLPFSHSGAGEIITSLSSEASRDLAARIAKRKVGGTSKVAIIVPIRYVYAPPPTFSIKLGCSFRKSPRQFRRPSTDTVRNKDEFILRPINENLTWDPHVTPIC